MAPAPDSARAWAMDESQARLRTKVARLYHERGIRQTEIAGRLHLSQARVSRLLKRASELGIVRTVVVTTDVHGGLEDQLEERYGLADAVVVDAEGDEQEILPALGSAGAGYLNASLTAGERLGISSWSATLLSVAERLHPSRTSAADSVTQLGGFGVAGVQVQANRLLSQLASALGANPTLVPAPGLVGSPEVREALLADTAVEHIAQRWRHLTTALVGIGSLEPSRLLLDSGNAGGLQERQQLRKAGPVGT